MVHLSYTGRSVRDNSLLPPSVLVSELVEALLPAITQAPADPAARARARARLVVEHPLQPFGERAFDIEGDPRVRSFQGEYADSLKQSRAALRPPPPSPVFEDNDDAEDAPHSSFAPFLSRPLRAARETKLGRDGNAPSNGWRASFATRVAS